MIEMSMVRTRILLLAFLLMPQMASAEILIVTSSKSKVTGLSRAEAVALFLGYATPTTNVASSALIDLPSGPIRDEFYLKLTGKTSVQMNAHWSRLVYTGKAMPPQEVKNIAEAKESITSGLNVIGYISRSELSSGSMRVLYVLQ